jgi:hypothetical protein
MPQRQRDEYSGILFLIGSPGWTMQIGFNSRNTRENSRALQY